MDEYGAEFLLHSENQVAQQNLVLNEANSNKHSNKRRFIASKSSILRAVKDNLYRKTAVQFGRLFFCKTLDFRDFGGL